MKKQHTALICIWPSQLEQINNDFCSNILNLFIYFVCVCASFVSEHSVDADVFSVMHMFCLI